MASIAAVLLVLCSGRGTCGAASGDDTPVSRWSSYRIMMWQPKTALQYKRLRELGVMNGMIMADRARPYLIPDGVLAALRSSGDSWYVENIATDFYSAYHRWTAARPVDWQFQKIKELYRANGGDPAAFRRQPSLSDPVWLGHIEHRLAAVVATQHRYHPLFYDLGDEGGIADLNAPWDFDFSDVSLRAFRRWLKGQYPSLASLNHEWGTAFRTWSSVMPMSTRAAMARTDGNLSSWSDFKAWMDVAYARALRRGTDAVHRADPTALAGIEGVQLPGWGGYDYSLLASAVDVMEAPPNWLPVLHALNPNLILLSTSFRAGSAERRRTWHGFLAGGRGLIAWDPRDEFVAKDGTFGARAGDLAPDFHTLQGNIGSLILNSRREYDPVAIVYSQASMRLQWMLDWRNHGDEWTRQDTDSQNLSNPWRRALRLSMEAVARQGLTPRFIAARDLEVRALRWDIRVLVLPDTLALSARAAAAIRAFVRRGGVAIAYGEPGRYDEHGLRWDRPPLHDLFSASGRRAPGDGHAVLLPPGDSGTELRDLGAAVRKAGVAGKYSISRVDGSPVTDIAIYRWRNGATTIIALEHIEGSVSGSGQLPGAAPPEVIMLRLPRARFINEPIAGRLLGHSDSVEIALDPVRPTVLVLSTVASGSTKNKGLNSRLYTHN